MLIGELFQKLAGGESMTTICDRLGIHRRTISRRLNHLGYQYDKDKKQWLWRGAGEEPVTLTITEDLNTANVIYGNHNITPVVPYAPEIPIELSHECLSPDELQDVRFMLEEWRGRSPEDQGDRSLYKQVKNLPHYESHQKEKKTFVIPIDIIEEFDRFATQERLNKSDLLQVALQDFFAKYRG
ncbi:hypothetical protein [Ammoniphilus sp. CFH 90114]|uniref:hypothetical protein n=1 Tax=Ammoniphilus sp. CFH 90114 TaxID=2493665 RepID=UPI0013E94173|nr:hypothetical protein [Ammoniphilus sp. CFH 90114]